MTHIHVALIMLIRATVCCGFQRHACPIRVAVLQCYDEEKIPHSYFLFIKCHVMPSQPHSTPSYPCVLSSLCLSVSLPLSHTPIACPRGALRAGSPCVAVCCSALQCVAVSLCNTLQHIVTRGALRTGSPVADKVCQGTHTDPS